MNQFNEILRLVTVCVLFLMKSFNKHEGKQFLSYVCFGVNTNKVQLKTCCDNNLICPVSH